MMNYDNEPEENKAPFGSLEEEVADDIPVMLSEGEYVIPADVVRYWGLKHLEEMRMMAKCGLMSMQQDGRLHMVDEDGEPVETEEPKAPQIEVVEIDIQAMQDDASEEEEDDDDDDMDAQMELFDDVDFDGKDEEDILKLEEGGDVMGGMGEPSGPNDGVGGGVAGDDDETGLGVATPEELQELQEGLVDIQDRAEKGLSKGYINAGKTYGVSNVDLQNLSVPEKKDLIDRTIDARHAQDPTAAQLDLNARTEKGFQAENPGVVGFTNTLATALSRVSPAIAATLAVGNVINAAQGKEGIGLGGLFGLDISGKIGQELSGSLQDLVDFSETVPGNIEETIDAGVEAGKEVGSSDQEPQVPKKALPDMNDLLNKTMKIKGIDKEIPIRNSLMSQTITT